MEAYYLLLDVGGTEIKMNALTTGGKFLLPKHKHAPALSQEPKNIIFDHFRTLLLSFIEDFQDEYKLLGIGLAFPGPFNYKDGISLMRGLRKYEGIYGLNLREVIQSFLTEIDIQSIPIIFENDATCFSIGEYYQNPKIKKGIYLTLGTGCGSGFIENGNLIASGYGLNKMGMIYDAPFKDGIIDQYLSVNGLKKLAKEKGYLFMGGKELAQDALAGNEDAQAIYHSFGLMIGEAIAPFVEAFQPEEIVFGGQISQSLPLYYKGVLTNLSSFNPTIRQSKDTTTSTLYGIYQILQHNSQPEQYIT